MTTTVIKRKGWAGRRFATLHPLRAWRGRARKWHPGLPHHEMICGYHEWWATQPRSDRGAYAAVAERVTR